MNSTVYNSKNKAILAILALILLIPTALAVYFASHKDTGAVTSGITPLPDCFAAASAIA